MKLPATIFREYDIRGTVGDQLTAEVAHAIGQAFATLAWERLGGGADRAPRLAVGRDNPPSGVELSRVAREGLVEAGGVALDGGGLPTLALHSATHTLGLAGGAPAP